MKRFLIIGVAGLCFFVQAIGMCAGALSPKKGSVVDRVISENVSDMQMRAPKFRKIKAFYKHHATQLVAAACVLVGVYALLHVGGRNGESSLVSQSYTQRDIDQATICLAELGDIPAITHVLSESIALEYVGHPQAAERVASFQSEGHGAYKKRQLTEMLTHKTSTQCLMVAKINKRVVGYICIKVKKDKKNAFIDNFYLLPSCVRKGLGKRLLEAALRQACEQNKEISCALLDVISTNQNACQAYHKMGFVLQKDPETGQESITRSDGVEICRLKKVLEPKISN